MNRLDLGEPLPGGTYSIALNDSGFLFLSALRAWRRGPDPEEPEGLLGRALSVALDVVGLPVALVYRMLRERKKWDSG